ncbi:MAG: cytochrome c biogenesis protein ResB, partial [Ignavibacteria bacterium]|nr:cytochrome c biogenesis protein ResB [Ignavibacteria bacterium]
MNVKKTINFLSSIQFFILNCAVLGVIAVIGIIVPQNVSEEFYSKEYGRVFSAFLIKTGFHRVFSSLWFTIPLGAFSLNLVLCVLKRLSSFWQLFRRLPDLDNRATTIKNSVGITGSLFLHAGLIVLIAGGVIQYYKGDICRAMLSKGKKISIDKFAIDLVMHDFSIVTNTENELINYQTDLELFDPQGSSLKRGITQVNHPLKYRNLYFYQTDYRIKPDAVENLHSIITDSTNADTLLHGSIPYQTNVQLDTSNIFIL